MPNNMAIFQADSINQLGFVDIKKGNVKSRNNLRSGLQENRARFIPENIFFTATIRSF